MLGRYQEAFDDYSKAILLKPDYANAWNSRAFVYLKRETQKQDAATQVKPVNWGFAQHWKLRSTADCVVNSFSYFNC